MKGLIFDVQRFCLEDGPGIRTTVFMKGCPLRCAWCHNPESQRTHPEILYGEKECIRCGACAAVCPEGLHAVDGTAHAYERSKCTSCGACAAACPAGALELCGREAEADEVLAIVLRDKDFYRDSGGGMTLSGGEPMAQPGFALELARGAFEAGVSVCVETCGFCAKKDLERMIPYVDTFLYDFKLADGDAHRRFTGAGNETILDNLAALDRAGARIVLRCPIIPGVNFTDGHFESIVRIAGTYKTIRQIDLEPYHPFGIEKARRLARVPAFDDDQLLPREDVEEKAQSLREKLSIPVVTL